MTKNNNEQQAKQKVVLQKYRDRLSILRQAQEYSQKDDIPRAVAAYKRYLDSLAAYFEIDEKKLNPDLFLKNNSQAEILLISQVYWDLAKAYDRSPKLQKECERCLDQFVKFSIGFKFQFINSEMLRKFMMKKNAYNPKTFERAFQKIKVNSKKCYIATYVYGQHHPALIDFRKFKTIVSKNYFGNQLIELYYRFSPFLIKIAATNAITHFVLKSLVLPLLIILHRPVKVFNRLINENN